MSNITGHSVERKILRGEYHSKASAAAEIAWAAKKGELAPAEALYLKMLVGLL